MLSDNFIRDFNFPSNVVDDFDTLIMPFIFHDDREIYEDTMRVVSEGNNVESVSCEFRLLHRNGEFGWVNMQMAMCADDYEQPRLISGIISRMDKNVRADYLTGLLNRNAFYSALQEELERTDYEPHGAVVIIGMDNFNIINETYGHKFGDNALRQVAQDITNVLPPDIRLYRVPVQNSDFSCRTQCPKKLKLFSQVFSFVCAKFATSRTRFIARLQAARLSTRTTRTIM